LSQSVVKAKQLGFTEPDPRDDLSGMDIARKALILARCMGIKMDLDDIEIESLYPKEMESLSIQEFMNNLHEMDEEMNMRISNTMKNGNRLRFVASINRKEVKVGLVEVDAQNALYHIEGTDNLISLKTEWYQSPLVISGPGAGLNVTAAGVLSDVMELHNLNKPVLSKL